MPLARFGVGKVFMKSNANIVVSLSKIRAKTVSLFKPDRADSTFLK